jgi:hypothetical protein
MTHQLLPITYDNIEAIAAAGFAKSRDCITAIRMDVLHNIQPLERVGFERLIKLIEARQIFKPEILEELDVQMDFLTCEIDKGTTVHQHRDYDECNVSAPACWQETQTTQRADELGRAMIMFFELYETLQAVHDLMHAQEALDALRQSL